MGQLNYQLILNQNGPLSVSATKKHVDLVVKEVNEVIEKDELQVKIEELSNNKYAVSMAAQLPNDTLVNEKQGKKIIPLLKKVKRALLKRLRRQKRMKLHKKRREHRRLVLT